MLYRLYQEGYDCSFWVQEKRAKPTYKGILPQVQTYSAGLKKSDIVFFDMVGLGFLADKLKKSGIAVYGGGKLNDNMELDRAYGMEVAGQGMKVPKYKVFNSVGGATKFVKNNKKPLAFKPLNNKSPMDTYISEDPEDMIAWLKYKKPKEKFILQEKVEGTEISTEAWYVNGELVPNSVNSTIETKRFMDGDKGPNTGCMTSVVWFGSKLYNQTLAKLEKFLKQKKYSGPLDVNCIVKDGVPYFLEFTTRFGYNAIYAVLPAFGEFGSFLSSLAKGKIPKIKPSGQYYGAVRISIPPFPNDVDASKTAGITIRGIDSLKDIFLLDAMYNDTIVTAGVDGVICEVTAKANDLVTLEKQIYSKVDNIKIPNKQYRSDAIQIAKKRLRELRGN